MESRAGKVGGQELSPCWHGAGTHSPAWEWRSAPGSCSADVATKGWVGLHPAVFRAAFQVCLQPGGMAAAHLKLLLLTFDKVWQGCFQQTPVVMMRKFQWPRAWAGSHGLSCSLFYHVYRAFISQVSCTHTSGLCCYRCALRVKLCSDELVMSLAGYCLTLQLLLIFFSLIRQYIPGTSAILRQCGIKLWPNLAISHPK